MRLINKIFAKIANARKVNLREYILSREDDKSGCESQTTQGKSMILAGDLQGALVCFDAALKITPGYVPALSGRGIVLKGLGQPEEALNCFEAALAINPTDANIYFNIGLTLLDVNQREGALKNFDFALAIKSDFAEASNSRGVVLGSLNRLEESIACFDAALAIKPEFVAAYNNRGIAYYKLNKFSKSLNDYDDAIALNSGYANAYCNRGNVLGSMGRFSEAMESYGRAIALKVDYADAYSNRGNLLENSRLLDEAFLDYSKAIALSPSSEYLYGHWLSTKLQLCDWSDYDDEVARLAVRINRGEKSSAPFLPLFASNSRELQKTAAETYAESYYPADFSIQKMSKFQRHDRIRLGYFSADFRMHAVSILTAELFEIQDRDKFELIAFSFGPKVDDEMAFRVRDAFDNFIDVRQHSDREVAMLARSLEIDIAIDLGGFTSDCRAGIFALRAAPIQVSYLGYLGTMGAGYIDYLIADSTIIPKSHRCDYAEKVVYLPSYQVNDTKRSVSENELTRSELGLPDAGFVFCCFNNNYKITPNTFDCWMRILKKVDQSVLWLLGDIKSVVANLKAEAARRGVDPRRLVFGARLPASEYLARYRHADLFLDTSPYNAGTTASDALWVGLPVITLIGETFAGRVAASLLNAIELPELICNTENEYERLAVALATQSDKLASIKNKLDDNRLKTRLFDTKRFCSNIESAFLQMYERYQSGLVPQDLFVD